MVLNFDVGEKDMWKKKKHIAHICRDQLRCSTQYDQNKKVKHLVLGLDWTEYRINFQKLKVLRSIEAKFRNQILHCRGKALDEIYQIYMRPLGENNRNLLKFITFLFTFGPLPPRKFSKFSSRILKNRKTCVFGSFLKLFSHFSTKSP